jgi:transposase-like protein
MAELSASPEKGQRAGGQSLIPSPDEASGMRLAQGGRKPRVPTRLLDVLDEKQQGVVIGLDKNSTRELPEVLQKNDRTRALAQRLEKFDPTRELAKRLEKLDLPPDVAQVLEEFDPTRGLAKIVEAFDLPSMDDSAVWRAGKAADERLLQELSRRDLRGVSLAVVMIDGKNIGGKRKIVGDRHKTVGGRQVIWALGITMDGTKIPLAITEDAKESGDTVEAMIRQMTVQRHADLRDVLWVIDGGPGLRAGIRKADKHAAIQRCVVHKSRNVVMDHLLAKERKAIGEEAYRRLREAWSEPNHADAHKRLVEISEWLKKKGHEGAAKSVTEGAEMTLTLQRLGVDDPVTSRLVNQTNMIESVHDAVDRRADRVKRWTDPPDTMRRRWVAAAIACAERKWHKVSESRPHRKGRRTPLRPVESAALERLSLAVLAARHPNVKLELDNTSREDTLALKGLEVTATGQGAVRGVLTDLRDWANRNGKILEVSDQAIDAAPAPGRLRAWIERESAGRTSDLARPRKRPANPLAVAREAVDERLAVGLAEAALGAAPDMVTRSDRELKMVAAGIWAASDALTSVERDAQRWWETNWRRAVQEIALHREQMRQGERPWRHPLDGGRATVLGEQRAQWLLGESRYQGGLIEGATKEFLSSHEQRIGSVLWELDEFAARIARAGRAVAACRELDRREQLLRVDKQVREAARLSPEPAAGEPSRGAAVPLKRYASALGERRRQLLQRYADALAPKLADLDSATLRGLLDEIGNPWRDLSGASAARTIGGEERDQPATLGERGKTLHDAAIWQQRANQAQSRHVRAAAEDQAKCCRETARLQWNELRAINDTLARERQDHRSLDRFIAERPDAALHHAVHAELDRRRELAAPERAEPVVASVSAATEVVVDVGM